MLIEGIFAAIPTPFYSDERLYLRKLEANVAHYSRSLLSGLLVLGSTGEAAFLNDEETAEILRTAAAAAAPDKVLLAGANRETVRETLRIAETAAEAGYDALVVRTPVYYAAQMTAKAVVNHFLTVADRSPLPVLLYNIPRCVPYNISVEAVAELSAHSNIHGIKDSSGDLDRIKAIVAATRNAPKRTEIVTPVFEAVTSRMLAPKAAPSDFVSAEELGGGAAVASAAPPALKTRTREVGFQVLTGSAGILLQSIEAGAQGAVLGFAACAPQACQEIYIAWKDRDPVLAAEKQARIASAARRVVGELGIVGVKYACDFNGFYGGRPRLPLLPLTAAERSEVETLLAGIRN